MKRANNAPRTDREPAPDRGDATRQKLLLAAIDVFGRHGFDGTTTRALANAAEVNLQAIPYYFGGKEGLYIAAAEHIGSMIASHVSGAWQRVHIRLADVEENGEPISTEEARRLLADILQTMAELLISDRSESWARFLIREQMAPTEAFARVYEGVMRPLLESVQALIGLILGQDPGSEYVRLRTLSLIGGVMVFRVAHAAAMALLDWKSTGPREVAAVRALAADIVASIGSGTGK